MQYSEKYPIPSIKEILNRGMLSNVIYWL